MSIATRVVVGACLFLTAPAPAAAWPGCEFDRVTAVMEGDTLVVAHDAATYNCCFDDIEYSLSWQADTLVITEIEILTESCPCLCCYSLSVRVADLPPGELIVTLVWQDYDTGGQESWSDQVLVPGGGSGGGPVIAGRGVSECLDMTGLPEVQTTTWGRVKSRYH